jgi:hypothetical protein
MSKSLEDLDALIQQKEAQLNPLCSQMETLRQKFIKQTAQFAATWYETTAKLYVTKNPEKTLSLNRTQLALMKAQVNILVKNAPITTKRALSEPDVWWHQAPDKNSSLTQYDLLGDSKVGNRFPLTVDKPVRHVLGELGAVLEKFGYGVSTGVIQKGPYPEFWFERSENGLSYARPYFPHLMEWSPEMQETLQEYNSLYKKAFTLLKEIVDLKDEKKKRQAGELWDST